MKLDIQALVKRFGEKEILHGISFSVESGRAMGFLGRNGAGKSTTIRCLMNVFKQDAGDILLDGKPFDPRKVRIGYLPEERGMYAKMTVLDQLVYFARLRGADKRAAAASAREWIALFGLSEYEKKPLETLSKGNQQKIQIAQAFLNDPDILILDEPFSGLDPVNAAIFKSAVKDFVARGKLVIFSSHQMGYVEEICDDITLIDHGSILMTGNLNRIKRRFGENKLLLRMDGAPTDTWRERLQKDFPSGDVLLSPDGLILSGGGMTQAAMLEWLKGRSETVARFGVYEPGLNDIFVQLAGENEK